MIFDPYALAAVVASLLMLVLLFSARGRARLLLAALFIAILAAFTWFAFTLGLEGLQIGWFLLFPYCLGFFGFALGMRWRGILKTGLLTFACVLTAGVVVLDVFFLVGQLLDARVVFTSDSFAKYIFVVAEALIVLVSLGIALLVALAMWIARLASKRER